jgi:hypothetical protein
MKSLILVFLCCTTYLFQSDLSQIRAEYPEAAKNEEKANKLYESLSAITKEDDKVLVAYKGAVSTIMAQFGKGIKEKTDLFKEGRDLLEYAVKAAPENIEIRCIRMSVQENSPKIVGYRDNIEDDKKFILTNYKHTRSKEVKKFVKNYALQSEAFDESEKQKFK